MGDEPIDSLTDSLIPVITRYRAVCLQQQRKRSGQHVRRRLLPQMGCDRVPLAIYGERGAEHPLIYTAGQNTSFYVARFMFFSHD